MAQPKDSSKVVSEYDELKDSRQGGLIKQFENYLLNLKVQMSYRDAEECRKAAFRNGQLDQIDQKVCLKSRAKDLNYKLMRILPELTQHANNYEQCLKLCANNHISYVVANQSCKAVYEKNFKLSTDSIYQRVFEGETPF